MDSLYNRIFQEVMERYGHLSMDELKAHLREEGHGDVVDFAQECLENNPELMEEIARSSSFGLPVDEGAGVMPSMPEVEALPVELEDPIFFDKQACLRSCSGNCCRNKNYLMIGITDIYRMVTSPAATRLGIRSTNDLFEGDPPLVQVFYNEEYEMFLPYLRYWPEGAAANTPPEDAPGSVCPFLMPIDQVYSRHGLAAPAGAGVDAQGCVLLRDKPRVCRLSPVGQFTGMETGTISYAYVPPARDCPACDTDVSIRLADHLEDVDLAGEREQDRRFLRILKDRGQRPLNKDQRTRYHDIIRQAYNIDGLLLRHDVDLRHRPSLERLVEVCMKAAGGDFVPFDDLVEELVK